LLNTRSGSEQMPLQAAAMVTLARFVHNISRWPFCFSWFFSR
jgi:hypothetical protein